MPGSIDVRSPSVSTTGYADGLGRRVIRFDRELGATLECLQLRPELAVYEHGLRAQAITITALDDERFVRVRGVERDGTRVSVTSELIAGDRLSDIIEARSLGDAAVSGLDAAFGFLLQVLPAVSRLHSAGLVHGIVAPGRVVLTPTAQVVLCDAIYGGVLPRLNLSRQRLWSELQVAASSSAGPVRFDAAADVAQAALCGLMLALGRVIESDDPVEALPSLVSEAAEIAQIRGGDHLAESVRRFFLNTLALSNARSRPMTADQAAREAQAIANSELGEDACLSALADFVRYDAPPAPVPVATVRPPAAAIAFEPSASRKVRDVVVPDAAPALEVYEPVAARPEPEPVAFEEKIAAFEEPVAVFEEPAPVETFAPEPLIDPIVARSEPEPEPFFAPRAAETLPEPVYAPEPAFVPKPEAPPSLPVLPEPEPAAFRAPEPEVFQAAEPIVAPPIPVVPHVEPVPEPLITRPSGDIVFQPAPVAAAPPPVFVPAPPVFPPAPLAPPPAPVAFAPPPPPPPMPVFQAPPTASAPTRPALVAPNPFAFAPAAPAPVAAPPVAASPAPLRIRQDGPSGYAPPRSSQRFEPVMDEVTFVHRADDRASGGFPKKLAIAVMVIMVAAVAGGRYLMMKERVEPRDLLAAPEPKAPEPIVQAKPPAVSGSTGTLAIESVPSGAKVLLNGSDAGVTPLRLEGLPQGRHTLTLITESTTVKRTVRVEAGKTVALDIPVFSGWIAIFAPIELQVSEGSKGLGSTEQGRILLAPGRHVLTVTNSKFGYSSTHTVEISAGEETPLNLTPSGQVNLNASPWAEVWIDGNRVGETPIANLEVPLGTRVFVFKHPQHGERRVTATVTSTPSAVSVDFTKSGLPN